MDKVVFAMSFFQIALQAVVAVEQIIGRGKGEGKRKVVVDAVQAVAKVAGESGHQQVAAVAVQYTLRRDEQGRVTFAKEEPSGQGCVAPGERTVFD